jgi:uncharacterized C2H2 Zn-finger protein
MDAFARIFEHHRESRTLICRSHRYAVPPSQVPTHLSAHHHENTAVRALVVEHIQTLDALAWTADQVQYPAAGAPALDILPIFHGGFKCQECGRITQTKTAIRQHCRKDHGWQSGKTRGGSRRTKEQVDPNQAWVEGVAFQRLFEYAQWKKNFEVAEMHNVLAVLAREGEAMLDALLEERSKARKERARRHGYNMSEGATSRV